jgi:6-pyruvoyl-tetrahydropterin synthase
MTALFVEQLTVIDAALLDVRRGLVGESWIVDVELDGALDEQSMVVDFGDVKKRLKRAVDATLDHTLLVPARSEALELRADDERTVLAFQAATGLIEHASPSAAVTLLDAECVDIHALISHLLPVVVNEVPANVEAVRLMLRPESIDGAHYCYSHGLKKHAGLCQRIAHGHRSRLQIRIDGARDNALEYKWTQRWHDIYLGTREDLVRRDDGRLRFEYTAGEGTFMLELPADRCDLLDVDSTVECIAEHIASHVAVTRPGHRIEVRAYEGVMKGAVARA